MQADGRHARHYLARNAPPADPDQYPLVPESWCTEPRDFVMSASYFRTVKGRRRCITPSLKLRRTT